MDNKELKDVSIIMGLSTRDVLIIYDIIENFANDTNYMGLIRHLITIFRTDIKPAHYVVLGHLIGYCLATDKEQATTNTINTYQLCQRQN